jgi:hypothetical protein
MQSSRYKDGLKKGGSTNDDGRRSRFPGPDKVVSVCSRSGRKPSRLSIVPRVRRQRSDWNKI